MATAQLNDTLAAFQIRVQGLLFHKWKELFRYEDEKMISYEMLEDEQEIQSIGKIFEELLEDVDVLMD